jgi:hypothetical protein
LKQQAIQEARQGGVPVSQVWEKYDLDTPWNQSHHQNDSLLIGFIEMDGKQVMIFTFGIYSHPVVIENLHPVEVQPIHYSNELDMLVLSVILKSRLESKKSRINSIDTLTE